MAPFGVELPDNLGSTGDTSVPQTDAAPAGEAPSGDTVSNEGQKPETAQEILDLDKLERFRFNGREWNPKEFRNTQLMREDYTRKTQELAEARKYADNFAHDLQAVAKDRSLFEKFKSIYPREYVALAEKHLNNGQTPNPQGDATKPQSQDPRLESLFERVEKWEASQREAEVKQIQSWLDNQYSTLSKKYPLADHEVINARAEVAAKQGTEITQAVLEKLFKANDQEIKAKWEGHYKTKVNQQKEAGLKGRDVGPGGGVPSGEPKRARTIKEATQIAIEDLTGRISR